MRAANWFILAILAFAMAGVQIAAAAGPERRLGLVIGNADYAAGTLPTAANDAGLIAQTLQAAGFDVMGARDLDGDTLRRTFRDFADKVGEAGPDAVVVIYLAGHGLQYEGDNYFTGVDAKIEHDVDVPTQALRINDFIRPIAASKPRSLIVVMDMARQTPFAKVGNPLAGGIAWMEPVAGTMFAANAAPGTIGPPETGDYGVYAMALAEMIREGDLPLETVFDRVRLRVNQATDGASVPWNAGKFDTPFTFFERSADAPPREASHALNQARSARPIRQFDAAEDAYFAALERDTLDGYVDFLDAYPDARQAKRVRALIAARREAITWRRSRTADTPNAYWTYLDRYPEGPHAFDARRRLGFLTAALDPPPTYSAFIYDDLPPPPEEELYYVRRRPVFYFRDPFFAFAPQPLCPVFFLPPPLPPLYFLPPPRPVFAYVLPVPVYVPVAVYVQTSRNIVAPQNNPLVGHIHDQAPVPVGAPTGGSAVAVPPGAPGPLTTPAPGRVGTAAAIGAGVVAGAVIGAAVAKVALPPSVAQKAALQPQAPLNAPRTGGAGLTGVGKNTVAPIVTPLPGAQGGSPLPNNGRPSQPRGSQVVPSGANPAVSGQTGLSPPAPPATQGKTGNGPSILIPPKAPPTISGVPKGVSPNVTAQPKVTPGVRDSGSAGRQAQEAAREREAQQARAQAQAQAAASARAQAQAAAQGRAQAQAAASARAQAQAAAQGRAQAQAAASARAQAQAQAQARAQQAAQAQQAAAAQARAQAAAQARAQAAKKPNCGGQGQPVCK